jgi:hypothetical protein
MGVCVDVCHYMTTGECQNPAANNNACFVKTGGNCPPRTMDCGFKPTEELDHDGSLSGPVGCASACNPGTSGPCQHLSLTDATCFDLAQSGFCPSRTIDCSSTNVTLTETLSVLKARAMNA